ncbi:MAG: septal ring lytic transglycosylase RlpA family protein [Actinomycetota bacterium]
MQEHKRFIAVIVLSVLLVAAAASAGSGYPVRRWWQYDPSLWRHSWKEHAKLETAHDEWHDNNPHAPKERHARLHERLRERHREIHFHKAISKKNGEASWYEANGGTGACGDTLRGFYAASPNLPCGSLVSVRANGKYVFVRILDRGPSKEGGRILDLSKRAFRKLANPSVGVLDVKSVRLER